MEDKEYELARQAALGDARKLAGEIMMKAGIKLDWDDPMFALVLAQTTIWQKIQNSLSELDKLQNVDAAVAKSTQELKMALASLDIGQIVNSEISKSVGMAADDALSQIKREIAQGVRELEVVNQQGEQVAKAVKSFNNTVQGLEGIKKFKNNLILAAIAAFCIGFGGGLAVLYGFVVPGKEQALEAKIDNYYKNDRALQMLSDEGKKLVVQKDKRGKLLVAIHDPNGKTYLNEDGYLVLELSR